MKIITMIICLLSIFLSLGCVTSRQKMTSNSSATNKKNVATNSAVKKPMNLSPEEMQDRKDRELLLKRKSELTGVKMSAVPQKRGVGGLNVVPQKILNAELSGLSDADLYQRLFLAYEKNDQLTFKASVAAFLRKYPQSVRADDALYLAGLNGVASKDYGTALKNFNRVIKEYSYSNKAPAALFAKAAVLKKMDLPESSQETYKQVLARYPQSPESERAQLELRLFK